MASLFLPTDIFVTDKADGLDVIGARLLTIFFQFERNPAHDCVNPQNDHDFKAMALCDIAPPPKRIALQSLSSNLKCISSCGFACDTARRYALQNARLCVRITGFPDSNAKI